MKIFIPALLIIVFYCFFVYAHELVHEKIYQYDGCNQTRIDYYLIAGSTYCTDMLYKESPEAKQAQMQNEIISYPGGLLILLVSLHVFTNQKL